jgi:DNA-binding NarL/FixJ family response regulator
VVLDLQIPPPNGVEVTRAISGPDGAVLILSASGSRPTSSRR